MLHDRERWRNSFSPGRTVKWIFLVLVDRSSETDTKSFTKFRGQRAIEQQVKEEDTQGLPANIANI